MKIDFGRNILPDRGTPLSLLKIFCLSVFLAATTVTAGAETESVFDFEANEVDMPPLAFTVGLTGTGPAARWRIKKVVSAPSGEQVVAQLSADRTNRRYPLLVHPGIEARDLDMSVRFKTISGEVDRSAGLIFRYSNSDNYYVVRANSLENNVVAYKTEAGKRSNIGTSGWGYSYGVDADVPHQVWNTLRVVVVGNLFKIYLNSRELFEVSNDVFTESGKIGLWTKADAVTYFDDLRVEVLAAE